MGVNFEMKERHKIQKILRAIAAMVATATPAFTDNYMICLEYPKMLLRWRIDTERGE